MSYLNINYSTLEDAWGRNFEKKHNKKGNSKDLCNLYNKRHSEIYKPYKTTQAPSNINPIYSDEDYTKYYGYKDGRPFSRKNRNIAKYKVNIPFTKPNSYQSPIISNNYISDEDDDDNEVVVKKSTRKCKREPYIQTPFSYIDNDNSDFRQRTSKFPILVEQEDDDDDYETYTQANMRLEQPDIDDSNPQMIESSNKFENNTSNKYLYEIDYDDDFDGYFEPSSLNPDEIENSYDNKYKKTECNEEDMYYSPPRRYSHSDNEYDKIVQSTLRENYTDPPTITTKSKKSIDNNYSIRAGVKHRSIREKIHFDLALYTVSGIILIFIMEQFIQIGMKIKNV